MDPNVWAKSLATLVKGYVSRSVAPLSETVTATRTGLDALRAKFEAWPTPEKGEKGEKGEPGTRGTDGEKGDRGEKGETGLTAYELAVALGFKGSDHDWLQSLRGEKGDRGEPGEKGEPGRDADPERLTAIERDVGGVREVVESALAELAKLPAPVTKDELVALALAALPPPRDGKDGRDGVDASIEVIKEVVTGYLPALENSALERAAAEIGAVRKQLVELNVAHTTELRELARSIEALPPPRDGKDGRDVDEAAVVKMLGVHAEAHVESLIAALTERLTADAAAD